MLFTSCLAVYAVVGNKLTDIEVSVALLKAVG